MTKPVIPKLEYDLVDHCNLGCRSCIHNAQLKPKGELDINVIEEEFKVLFDKFDVERIILKGGEPLIHSNIIAVLTKIRRCLPQTTGLYVATNGIKLATLPDHFFTIIKHLNIEFCISEYDESTNYPKIYQKLKEKQIPYSYEEKVIFYDFLDASGQQDPVESFIECRKRRFFPLYRDKRFYLCCFVYDVPFMNGHLQTKIESNSVSIDDDIPTILTYLSGHCSTCRFCSAYKKPHIWETQRTYEKRELLPNNQVIL